MPNLDQDVAAASCGDDNDADTVKTPVQPALSPGPAGERETREGGEAEAEGETEEEKARRLLYCSLCKVAVNSASQLQAHNSGETR